ncbi:uncharacterized protein LOC117339193 isoform X3 [Pecten maximus]|uniref:uncharacterized protein LOC117339193 isoform X3 n=1 Tax=Pecten maximus TaxID=6579 RepID=UPI0014591786|nr:uncharacterized protein LOC117339193 isoform X3 [Pecten maximus]
MSTQEPIRPLVHHFPPGGLLEIAISFDTTGSMYDCLEEVRGRIQDMVQRLQADIPGIRIAIIAHGDYFDAANYIVKWIDFGATVPELCDFVKTVSRTSGGDADECYELVLRRAREVLSWTPGSQRSLVVIGDSSPHEVGYRYGDFVNDINWRVEAHELYKMGVKIYSVAVDTSPSALLFYTDIANMTGGKVVSLAKFGVIFDILMSICYKESGSDLFEAYEAEVRERNKEKEMESTWDDIFTTLRTSAKSSDPGPPPFGTGFGSGPGLFPTAMETGRGGWLGPLPTSMGTAFGSGPGLFRPPVPLGITGGGGGPVPGFRTGIGFGLSLSKPAIKKTTSRKTKSTKKPSKTTKKAKGKKTSEMSPNPGLILPPMGTGIGVSPYGFGLGGGPVSGFGPGIGSVLPLSKPTLGKPTSRKTKSTRKPSKTTKKNKGKKTSETSSLLGLFSPPLGTGSGGVPMIGTPMGGTPMGTWFGGGPIPFPSSTGTGPLPTPLGTGPLPTSTATGLGGGPGLFPTPMPMGITGSRGGPVFRLGKSTFKKTKSARKSDENAKTNQKTKTRAKSGGIINRETLTDAKFTKGPLKRLVWSKWMLGIAKTQSAAIGPDISLTRREWCDAYCNNGILKGGEVKDVPAVYEFAVRLSGKKKVYPVLYKVTTGVPKGSSWFSYLLSQKRVRSAIKEVVNSHADIMVRKGQFKRKGSALIQKVSELMSKKYDYAWVGRKERKMKFRNLKRCGVRISSDSY